MTQEFVTLPREVVEQALEALTNCTSEYGHRCSRCDSEVDPEEKATSALRAALEQPQANQPAMTPIAQRKLEDLVASGYTISGYSIYHKQKHQHGFVTGAGLVGWWKPDGVEYQQPLGEQEPMAFIYEYAEGWTTQLRFDGSKPLQVIPLYTHPQPKHEPLTDEQIGKIGREHEKFSKDGSEWFDRWTFARAIEAAHNIK